MNNYKTNQELASDFERLVGARPMDHVDSYQEFSRVARTISSAQISIPEYFELHGNLNALEVPGVGAKSKPYLVALLIDGFEEAKRKQDLRVQRKSIHFQWADIPGSGKTVRYDENWSSDGRDK